jgi:hypothetical protein
LRTNKDFSKFCAYLLSKVLEYFFMFCFWKLDLLE